MKLTTKIKLLYKGLTDRFDGDLYFFKGKALKILSISEPKIRVLQSGRYVILENASIAFELEDEKYRLDIPTPLDSGGYFVSDGASIPEKFEFHSWGVRLLIPSFPHDYIYDRRGRVVIISLTPEDEPTVDIVISLSRGDADLLFKKSIEYLTNDKTLAKWAYRAVRVFGASHWRER